MDGTSPLYVRSADTYDLIYDGIGKDYLTESREVAAGIRDRCPGAATLLDVGCGTGKHLVHLGEEGFAVEGLELSGHMAARARARLPGVTIHEGDMRTFALARRYDAVTCLFSSIGYARTEEDLDRTCAAMARHVTPGGVVVVDAWYTPDTWIDGYVGAVAVADEDRAVTRADRSWRLGRTSVLEMTWVVARPAGTDTFVERHELGLFRPEETRAALERAGLVEVEEVPGVVNGDRSRWFATAP